MHLDEATIGQLQSYLISNLEPICVAEPSVLAKYVIALLQNDKPREELQRLCEDELQDFLKEETPKFVEHLFSVLLEDSKGNVKLNDSALSSSTSKVNSVSSNSTSNTESINAPAYNSDREYSSEEEDKDYDHKHARREISPDYRKRREEDSKNGESYSQNFKRRRREDYNENRERNSEGRRRDDRRGNYRRDRFDKDRNRDEGRRRRGQRPRCRDYDEKGFCVRGELCPYDHGSDRIVVTDVQSLEQLKRGQDKEIYDPSKPLFGVGDFKGFPATSTPFPFPITSLPNVNPMALKMPLVNMPPLMDMNQQFMNPLLGSVMSQPMKMEDGNENIIQVGGKGMHNNDRRKNQNGDSGSRRFKGDKSRDVPSQSQSQSQSSNQPSTSTGTSTSYSKPSQTTLCVANIPADMNTIDKLNSHFKKFGTIVNIQVKPNISKAFIQFTQHSEAQAALSSTEAVLGNRFIRLFWSKRQDRVDHPPPSFPTSTAKQHTQTPIDQQIKNESSTAPSTPAASSTATAGAQSPMAEKKQPAAIKVLQKQKEDLRKQQLEQTKQLLETLAKAKNLDPKQKDEIMKKVSSLANNVQSSIQKDSSVLAKVAAKTKTTAPPSKEQREKELLDRELEQISQKKEGETTEVSEAATKSETLEKLQKRYNSLQKMAESMGIEASVSGTKRPKRTPGKPRAKKPRVTRNTMVLDNRPTTLLVTKLPEELRNVDALKAHFGNFGQIVSVTQQGDEKKVALIQFATRKEAEAAVARGKPFKSQTLSLGWYNPTPKTSKTETRTSTEESKDLEAGSEDGQQTKLEEEEVVQEVYDQPMTEFEEREIEDEGEDEEERSWKRT